MGDIQSIAAAGNQLLQEQLAALVRDAQRDDPLAAVTIVVDDAAQGWALRRQLARHWPAGGAVANVRTLTVGELLDVVARLVGGQPAHSTDSTLRVAVTESVLRRQTGLLGVSRNHPDTAIRLSSLYDELGWCRLEGAEISSLEGLGVSSTSQAAIAFVADARSDLAIALGERTLRGVADDACERLSLSGESPGLDQIGTVIITARRVPEPIARLLRSLADSRPVHRVVISPGRGPRPEAVVIDCPDPMTESGMAARVVAAALADGATPSQIAVLYSVDQPYAKLLEDALDAAGIAWHGPTGLTLQATAVARYVTCLAQMAAARVDGASGITRRALMTWFSIGSVYDGSERVPSGAFRALIRQEGLYADARRWTGRLEAIAAAAAAAAAADDEATDEDDTRSRRRNRLGVYASGLLSVIRHLDDVLDAIATADTWTRLGDALWSALETFHLQRSGWQSAETERAAHATIAQVLRESLPGVDAFLRATADDGLPPSASDVAQMLERVLARRRSRAGASGTGVHVGPITSARGLVFERIVIVGAAEGLLPMVAAEDPLLPHPARAALRQVPDDLPTSLELEAAMADDVRALCVSGCDLTVTFPRGAIPGRGVASVSRYFTAARPLQVASARSALTLPPTPIADLDLALRESIGSVAAPEDLMEQTTCATAWARPGFDVYFGNPGSVDGEATWTMNGRTLSASGIEAYLHCPYHFFVRRVLDVNTDEPVDDVDEVSPSDMGSLLHRALERFVNDARDRGTLPGPGATWPSTALADLGAILDEEVERAHAQGLTGWRPAWERTYAILRQSLAAFLEADNEFRADPPVRPEAAEVEFGMGDGPAVGFRVNDDVVVGLRGSMDRVDVGVDPSHAGVIDYKSGKAEYFVRKLGIPKKDGTVPDREKVQDLVYDVAIRTIRPQVDDVDVRFFFVPNGGEPLAVPVTHEPDRAGRLREVLQSLETAGASGAFPPKPQGRNDYCPVCGRLGRRADLVAASIAGTPVDDDEEGETR